MRSASVIEFRNAKDRQFKRSNALRLASWRSLQACSCGGVSASGFALVLRTLIYRIGRLDF